jgi:hypothetical protein
VNPCANLTGGVHLVHCSESVLGKSQVQRQKCQVVAALSQCLKVHLFSESGAPITEGSAVRPTEGGGERVARNV